MAKTGTVRSSDLAASDDWRAGTQLQVDHEALWPRDERHRYRVYARIGKELTVLCACPEPGGIGQALVAFHDDQKQVGQRLADLGQIGVLDVIAGDWIVLPWARREDVTTFGTPTAEVQL